MRRWPVTLYLLSLIVSMGAIASEPQTPPAGWGMECIGRQQFLLPLDVEVAVTPVPKIESLFGLSRQEGLPSFSFADGEVAGYSNLVYAGNFQVSDVMSQEGLRRMLAAHQTTNLSGIRKRYAGRTSPDGKTYSLLPFRLDVPKTSVYQFYGSHFDIAVEVGHRLVRTTTDTEASSSDDNKEVLESFVQSMSPRSLFEVPPRNGVCMPYIFIEDDGNKSRDLAATYRLKGHPDVTVWIDDSEVTPSGSEAEPANDGPRRDNEAFWNLRYQERKKYRFLQARSTKIANMQGASSLIEMVREDDSVDYGLYASAHSASGERVQLYIIRNQARATAKGIKPLEKEEFLRLGNAIIASVQRRPVQTLK